MRPGTDAITEARCTVGSTALALPDIVDMEAEPPAETPRYQRENCILKSWAWVVRGRATRAALEDHVDEAAPIFYNALDRVVDAVLDQLRPGDWKSLQLVRPRQLRFEHDAYQPQRWRARFKDRAGHEYLLKVTDPEATRRLQAGERPGRESLLTVSLTRPWQGHDPSMLRLCYKVVAAVIDDAVERKDRAASLL